VNVSVLLAGLDKHAKRNSANTSASTASVTISENVLVTLDTKVKIAVLSSIAPTIVPLLFMVLAPMPRVQLIVSAKLDGMVWIAPPLDALKTAMAKANARTVTAIVTKGFRVPIVVFNVQTSVQKRETV
jgi:hypothetical protein